MILYHFTFLDRFGLTKSGQFEWTADLRPEPSAEWAEILGFAPEPMVWLTTEPNPKHMWVEDAYEAIVSGRCLRITVDLDDLDRDTQRLVHWRDYLDDLERLVHWRDDLDRDTQRLVRWWPSNYHSPKFVEMWDRNAAHGAWGGTGAVWVYFGTIANAQHRAVKIWRRITSAEAIGWITKAVPKGKKPTAADMELLVKVANAERDWVNRDRDPVKENSDSVQIQKARAVFKHLRGLRTDLPGLVDVYAQNEPGEPVTRCLSRLAEALDELANVAPYMFDKPQRSKETWHVVMWALKAPIEEGLRAAGEEVIGDQDTSPLPKVMCFALEFIFGRTFEPAAVARELREKRFPRKKNEKPKSTSPPKGKTSP
jgi:hypothetical protein